MSFSRLNYINTGRDGVLAETTTADIDRLFETLRQRDPAPRIVLHFHGGLVNHAAGMAIAKNMYDHCYRPDKGMHPISFVWESGLGEVVGRNLLDVIRASLGNIEREAIFRRLLKWLLKFAVAKVTAADGAKGDALRLPTEIELATEMAALSQGKEPFIDEKIPPDLSDFSDSEAETLVDRLSQDEELVAELEAIIIEDASDLAGAKGLTGTGRASRHSLMSPDVVGELRAEGGGAQPGGKGILAMGKFAWRVARILQRVVRRFRQGRDHGLYPTVVEEILRDLYVANIGMGVWHAMKQETAETFEDDPGGLVRGGRYFMGKLRSLVQAGWRPDISLVGHSTGAVFINHLLASMEADLASDASAWPDDFRFRRILFLAPACTFENFEPTISLHGKRFVDFRMFTMTDAAESSDVLVKGVYTRSLLYFISGALEPAAGNSAEVDFDKPLVGLQRNYTRPNVYPDAVVEAGRGFVLASGAQRVVWSPVPEQPPPENGLKSRAVSHGDFDNDPATLESLAEIITA